MILMKKKDSFSPLRNGKPFIDNMSCITTDNKGYTYIGTYDGIWLTIPIWKIIRLIWIGNIKENHSCYFNRLPIDIIKIIISYINMTNI